MFGPSLLKLARSGGRTHSLVRSENAALQLGNGVRMRCSAFRSRNDTQCGGLLYPGYIQPSGKTVSMVIVRKIRGTFELVELQETSKFPGKRNAQTPRAIHQPRVREIRNAAA
jgi:hypothetical protein